jgi:choline monooxygenase
MSASSPETLPATFYRSDPARWAEERRNIFARSWQVIGHESALEAPGQWLAETLAGYPILVVRDEQGTLRGYHNVCRHRAGPLTDGERGTCEGLLVCRYHGWAYALDGRLRSARDFGPSSDFDPRGYGLFPVRVDTWRGLIFVAIAPEVQPLSDLMRPLDHRLGDRDWSTLRLALVQRHPIACDWKTYVENYLEGYHLPLVHRALDAEIDSARYVVRVDGAVALHEAPHKARDRDGPDPVYAGLWAWVWPNLGVNVYGRGLMIERMSPAGPGACRLDYLYLTPNGAEVPLQTLDMAKAVVAEDAAIVEAVQVNLDAGVYESGRLSPRHEGAVAGFQAMVRQAMSESPRATDAALQG